METVLVSLHKLRKFVDINIQELLDCILLQMKRENSVVNEMLH